MGVKGVNPILHAILYVDGESWSASSLQVQQGLAMKGHMAFPQRGIRQPSFQASILLVPTLPPLLIVASRNGDQGLSRLHATIGKTEV